MTSLDLAKSRRVKACVLIAWPAFLAACLIEALVFAAVNPSDVHWPGLAVQPSPKAVYTVAFFVFWLIAMAASSLAVWLSRLPRDVNDTTRG